MIEAMLVADRLTRHFGGLTANLEVCITLARGELHALLGPNGAGKRPASTCSRATCRPPRGASCSRGRT